MHRALSQDLSLHSSTAAVTHSMNSINIPSWVKFHGPACPPDVCVRRLAASPADGRALVAAVGLMHKKKTQVKPDTTGGLVSTFVDTRVSINVGR